MRRRRSARAAQFELHISLMIDDISHGDAFALPRGRGRGHRAESVVPMEEPGEAAHYYVRSSSSNRCSIGVEEVQILSFDQQPLSVARGPIRLPPPRLFPRHTTAKLRSRMTGVAKIHRGLAEALVVQRAGRFQAQ